MEGFENASKDKTNHQEHSDYTRPAESGTQKTYNGLRISG
jgi:hypothetical protein